MRNWDDDRNVKERGSTRETSVTELPRRSSITFWSVESSSAAARPLFTIRLLTYFSKYNLSVSSRRCSPAAFRSSTLRFPLRVYPTCRHFFLSSTDFGARYSTEKSTIIVHWYRWKLRRVAISRKISFFFFDLAVICWNGVIDLRIVRSRRSSTVTLLNEKF